jgi:polyhydroxybutyrate depolymerase
MKTISLLIFCAFLLAACSPVAAPTPTIPPAPTSRPSATVSTDCAAGTHLNQIESNGQNRQYRLYVPSSYQPGKPVALVFGFHGNTGHADQFEAYTKFSVLAEREGFIVVYPQGAGERYPTWDTWKGSKDVQFVSDLMDHMATICNIDPRRIYAMGHSLGGGMINRLACDLADRIAAIGPVSGAYQNATPCDPSQPVAVIAVHGTADTDVFYQGIPPNGRMPEAYTAIGRPIPQWASAWAGRNNCDDKATVVFKQDPVSAQQWGNCRNAADVVLYTINGGKHGWPNPADGFDAAQTVWDFFVKHPLAQ